MKLQFRCYYCSNLQWVDKDKYKEHMWDHKSMGDDVGTIGIAETYDGYIRRLSAVGIINDTDVRQIDE